MPFGRHTGIELDKIPAPYLRWVVQNVDLDYKYPGLKKQIKAILRGGTAYPRLAPYTSVPSPMTRPVLQVRRAGVMPRVMLCTSGLLELRITRVR